MCLPKLKSSVCRRRVTFVETAIGVCWILGVCAMPRSHAWISASSPHVPCRSLGHDQSRRCKSTSITFFASRDSVISEDKRPPNDVSTPVASSGRSEVLLFSLDWTPDSIISKPNRDLWKWKDEVLGDGRDFFVPKPKTIRALQDYCVQTTENPALDFTITECSILSNCARFEVLVTIVTPPSSEPMDLAALSDKVLNHLCVALRTQHSVYSERQRQPSLLQRLTKTASNSVDWPEQYMDLQRTDHTRAGAPQVLGDLSVSPITISALELSKHWTLYSGVKEICQHACLVSGGMASRPRRPDREVIFRPFSSRDAHILLQLKRTKEIVSRHAPAPNDVRRPSFILDTIWEYALRAGKAARNVDKVPDLKALQGYGSGDNQKYATDAPKELLDEVVSSVQQMAFDPLVAECVAKVSIRTAAESDDSTSSTIIQLRRQAEAMANSENERKLIRRLLHQPTMALRNQGMAASMFSSLDAHGEGIVQKTLEDIERALQEKRSLV